MVAAKKQREERERQQRAEAVKASGKKASGNSAPSVNRPSFQYKDGVFVCDVCKVGKLERFVVVDFLTT